MRLEGKHDWLCEATRNSEFDSRNSVKARNIEDVT